jgi:hypothetical protein
MIPAIIAESTKVRYKNGNFVGKIRPAIIAESTKVRYKNGNFVGKIR